MLHYRRVARPRRCGLFQLQIYLLIACASLAAAASERSSANYSIFPEGLDVGGRDASSGNYQQVGSVGFISGTSNNGPGGLVVSSGYVAQVNLPESPLEVVSAVSRKVHGASGQFDINLPLNVAGIECRAAGAGGTHQILVTFATPITANGVSVMSRDGLAGATLATSNATVTVNLTGVANAQTLGITLVQVSNGSTTADVVIPVSILLGDTTGNGSVGASDIGQTKSQSGQPMSAANFRADVNVSGSINASDIGLVKSASGTSLP